MIRFSPDLSLEEIVLAKRYTRIPQVARALNEGDWEILRCRPDNTHLRRAIPLNVETITHETTSATASEAVDDFNEKFQNHERYEMHSWLENGVMHHFSVLAKHPTVEIH